MNFNDETWRSITEWAEKQIQIERERNDDVARDVAETAFSRGRISLLKDLLALPSLKAAQAWNDKPE